MHVVIFVPLLFTDNKKNPWYLHVVHIKSIIFVKANSRYSRDTLMSNNVPKLILIKEHYINIFT